MAFAWAPTGAEAADLKLELDFVVVRNEGDTLARPWTVQQVQDLIAGANQVFAGNGVSITLNWPKKPTLLRIDDPQKGPGAPGDVKVPPVSGQAPYWGDHLEGGAAGVQGDDKTPLESFVVCNNAWANANPNTLAVALVQNFVDLNGAAVPVIGLAFTNGLEQPGVCSLISARANANPQTLAHELGHVLCLGHVNKTGNLMLPVKAPGGSNTALNPAQVAQLCPKQVQQKLSPQPGKFPTSTPTPPAVGGVAELPGDAALPATAEGGSGSRGPAVAGAIVAIAAGTLILVAVAWLALRRADRGR